MKKKLLSFLLTLIMILSLGTSALAAESSNILARSSNMEDILEDLLNKDDLKVEAGQGTIKLDTPKNYTVNADLSTMIYTFKLTSDKSINLSYESNAQLFEIMIMSEDFDDDIIWTDNMLNLSEKKSNNVNLKLKKGEYTIIVGATKGSYTVSPMTTSTLKTMSPFTVNRVYPGATSISGKGVAGAKIVVMDENYKTYTTTVKSDNTFKLTIPKQEEDSELIVKITKDGYGAKIKSEYVEYNEFTTFTVSEVKSTSTYVKGKGKSGATVTAYVGSAKIGTAKVKSDGTYSIKIKKQASGKKIKVKMSKTGYRSVSKTVTVKKVFTKKLTVNTIRSTSKYISGKGSKGATVTAYVNNKKIGKATVKSNGTYSMKISKQSKGKVVTVKMSKSGYSTVSKAVKVK